MARKRICIIAFKDVRRTIHVLRQIDYLSPHYDLTVIGYGEPDPSWRNVEFRRIPEPTRATKLSRYLAYALGKLAPTAYADWYWGAPQPRVAMRHALESGADAFHANDLIVLPIAVEAARLVGGKVVAHLHEYSVLEREDSLAWRLVAAPAFRYLLRRYANDPDVPLAGAITVCEPIAERYGREWGIEPMVVSYNAPRPVPVPETREDGTDGRVRMIHHGFAKRGRGLHNLVRAVGLADQRFTLDFMLVEDDPGYVDELRRLGEEVAPGRIAFREPVQPHEIVRTVAEYTLGLCVIEPTTYNNLMMLPNKFFEYVQGGLALCVGPSPAMVNLVERYEMGVCAPTFEPADVAATLNALTPDQIGRMRANARAAAGVLNADVEMGKIVAMYRELLDSPSAPKSASRATRGAMPVGASQK